MDGKNTQTNNPHSATGQGPAGEDRSRRLLRAVNEALARLLSDAPADQALFQACRALGEGAGARGIFLFFENPDDRRRQFACRKNSAGWEPTESRGWAYPLSEEKDEAAFDRLQAGRAVFLEEVEREAGASAAVFPLGTEQGYSGSLTLLFPGQTTPLPPEAEQWLAPFREGLTFYLQKLIAEEAASPGPDPYKNFFENSTDAAYYTNCGRPIPIHLSVEEQTRLYFENAFLQEGNEAMAKAYGYPGVEAMAGRKVQPPTGADIAQFQAFVRNGYRLTGVETTHTLEDGSRKYFLGQAAGVVHDGCLIGFWGTQKDVTEKRLAEDRILAEQKLKQDILATIPDYILVVDYDSSHFTYLNQRPDEKALGYRLDELKDPIPFLLRRVHPADLKTRLLPFSKKMAWVEDEDIPEEEFRIRSADGDWVWLHLRAKIFRRHPDGRVKEYLLLLQDVTTAREAARRIGESEKRYRNFISYSTDGIYYVACGRPIPVDLPVEEQVKQYYETAYVEECNQALARMYGSENVADINGTFIRDWHGGEHFEENARSFIELARNGYRVRNAETIEADLHGNLHYFLNQAVGIVENGRLIGIWGTQQDITEKKLAEQALRESEERLERILEGAKLGVWDWDLRTQQMTTNDQWARMLGYKAGEIAPTAAAFFDLVHPDDREKLDQAVVQHLAGSTRHFELEIRMRTRAGDWKWIYDRGQIVLRDEDGTPLRAFGVHIDITERKQAELALMDREALFRSIFETSPLGITFSNARGRIRQVNQKLCEILGYERDQLVGKAFSDITHPDDRPMEKALAAKSKKNKPSFLQYEKRFLHREGMVIWASVAVSFIYHPDGRLNYTIGMVEDITEKKNAVRDLEKSEALQKAVIAAMPDVKFRFNSKGTYLDYYPSADTKDHPFVSPDRFLHKNVSQVLPAPVADTLRRGIEKAIKKAKVQTIEFSLPEPEGEKFYEARISAINQEEAVVIVRDITDRIEAEANLQDKLQELDFKNQQLKAYIDSNLQLENFAYIASHDLREPVRTMRSFAQLLQQRHRDQLNQQAREYLQFITDGAESMNRLIEDLLTYSRVNSQPHDRSEVSPAALIEQVTAELTGALRETGAEIETENLPDTIIANPTRLRQLFQNLIGNAVKFHRPGAPPRVRITGRDRGAYWQFAVADNGIGIQPEFHEKIFRLFQKLHPGSAYQGTGLGLAICKKIVEQHQGDIWLSSEPGVGTTFFFTIRKTGMKSTNDK